MPTAASREQEEDNTQFKIASNEVQNSCVFLLNRLVSQKYFSTGFDSYSEFNER